jgi:rod shape-determining protein MreC
MNNLLANRTTRRRGVAYALLLSVTLIMMAFSNSPIVAELQHGVGFAFRPIQSVLSEVAGGISSVGGAITEIDTLRVANQQLRDDNARLTAENARLAEIKREYGALTGLLQVRNGLSFQTVTGQVVARESSEFRRVVSIDQGTERGIAVGDVVIAAGGALAGRVIEAGQGYARVQLMTDTESTVIGQVQNSATTGEVVGQLGGVLVMQNVDAADRPKIGDEVVTAGIELSSDVRSPYPKGLLIGQVVDVKRDANAVVQTVYLEPAIDLDKLEFVLVITNYQGGLPDAGRQPTQLVNPDGTLPDSEQPYVPPSATPKPSPTTH